MDFQHRPHRCVSPISAGGGEQEAVWALSADNYGTIVGIARGWEAAGRVCEERGEAWVFELIVRPVGIPIGFKNACEIWTKISRVLTAKWRREGKRLVYLLDDFIFAVSGDLSLRRRRLCEMGCWQISRR